MTTGAGNDIEDDGPRARWCEWGLSSSALTFGKVDGEVFLGHDFGHHRTTPRAASGSTPRSGSSPPLTTGPRDHRRARTSCSWHTLLEKGLDSEEVLQIIAETGTDIQVARRPAPKPRSSPEPPRSQRRLGPLVPAA
jgi:hypothetical protein